MGKSLSFDQIKTTELNEKKLTITKVNGKKVTFDLNEIAESDAQKLNENNSEKYYCQHRINLMLGSVLS